MSILTTPVRPENADVVFPGLRLLQLQVLLVAIHTVAA